LDLANEVPGDEQARAKSRKANNSFLVIAPTEYSNFELRGPELLFPALPLRSATSAANISAP